eukprot:jgi/Bigna1/142456/aug1.70_g17164
MESALQVDLEAGIAGTVVLLSDRKGEIIHASSNVEEVYGHKPKDLVGTRLWSRVHPLDARALKLNEQNFIKHVTSIKSTASYRVRTKNGFAAVTVHYKKQNGSIRIFETYTGSHVHAQDEYLQLIETANAPIFGVDMKLCVNEWNHKAAMVTGYIKNEVMGKNLVDNFIHAEDRAKVREVIQEALSGKETENFVFPLYTKRESKKVVVLLNASTRRNALGEPVGMIGVGQDITDLKTEQRKNEILRKEYERLIDDANAPIFGVDTSLHITEWNKKIVSVTGYKKSLTFGQPLKSFINADEWERTAKVIQRALLGQQTENFVLPLFTADKQRVIVLLNASPRRNLNGDVVGVIGVGQDITRMRQVTQERDVALRNTRILIQTANAPIFGVDMKGNINEWNRKAAQITGFSKEEVLKRHLIQNYITQEYREQVQTVFDKAFKGESTSNFQFPLFSKTGERVEVLLNASPTYNVQGQLTGCLGVGQDVTKMLKVQAELQRIGEDSKRLIDTSNAPIFGVDRRLNITEWNQKAVKITGYSRLEVLGKNLIDDGYIRDEHKESVKTVILAALEGKETENFEFPLYTKDGSKRIEILLNASSRRDVMGGIVGVIGVGQDITEMKQVTQERDVALRNTRILIQTANAPIFGVDIKGNINEWNRKAAKITGFSKEEVLGKLLVQNYITQEYREQVQTVFDKAFKGESTSNFQFPLFSKTGERVEVLLNASPTYNVQGQLTGCLGVGQDITQMLRIQLERDRIGEDSKRLIDTSNAPIFGVDRRLNITEWNQKAVKITGYSRLEVLGKNLIDDGYIRDEHKESVKTVILAALEGKETENFEFPLYTKDGSKRIDILLNASARRDVQERVVGMIGVGQDITDMKQVTRERDLALRNTRSLVKTANAPIFGVDMKGNINEWNRKAAEITGFSKHEVLGKHLVQNYITEEYREEVQAIFDKAFEGQNTSNFQFPLFSKTGDRVEVLLNASPTVNVQGELTGCLGVGQDITQMLKVQIERDRIGEDSRRLIDTSNAPIFGVDRHLNISEWNQKAAKITGYTRAEVLGKNLITGYIRDEHKNSVQKVLESALTGVDTENFEFPLYTKDGRARIEILLNASARRDATGTVVGMIGVGQDITSLKHEQRKNEQLMKAQKALYHGVKNALAGMLAQLGIMRSSDGPNTVKLARIRNIIDKASDQELGAALRGDLNNFLSDISSENRNRKDDHEQLSTVCKMAIVACNSRGYAVRIQHESFKPSPKRIDCLSLLEEMRSLSRRIEIGQAPDVREVLAHADEMALYLILDNVLNNARAHSPERSVIRVSCWYTRDNHGNHVGVTIQVSNKMKDHNENQSDVKKRKDNPSSEERLLHQDNLSQGMGLSIIRDCVKKCKYKFDAGPEGSLFYSTLRLPVWTNIHKTEEIRKNNANNAKKQFSNSKDFIIACVEDMKMIRKMYERVLIRKYFNKKSVVLGSTLHEAKCAAHCIMKAGCHACILDQNLEYGSDCVYGTDIAYQLAELKFKGLIYIRSANNDTMDIQFYKEKGAFGTMCKSMTPAEIRDQVMKDLTEQKITPLDIAPDTRWE